MAKLGMRALLALAIAASAAPALGQIVRLPPVPTLPGAALPGVDLGRSAGDLIQPVERAAAAVDPTRILGRQLLRRNPKLLEADEAGRPIVRGEVTAVAISPDALARAESEGFRLKSRDRLAGLDLDVAVLAAPDGVSAVAAAQRLRTLDPQGRYDVNPIYFESGGEGRPAGASAIADPPSGRGLRIGLVDGSADARVPGLAHARLVQQAFGPGGAKVTAHATAVASLIAGEDGAFHGAAPGATLLVADVYGPTPVGGSAVAVTRGLAWLAEQGAPVINISLVGPPNALLAAAVQRLVARGHLLVAAVGNDGPAAPPLYPAAYPGVVGVTGVDSRRRVLPEAARGPQVAFAAPGADLAAAAPGRRYVGVRGTSYAAPWVAGLLARRLPAPDPEGARRAIERLASEAVDLGPSGRDATYGWGGVALGLAVRPDALDARR